MDFATGVVIALVVVVAVWAIATYNRLRVLGNRVENAWSQIDVQLKRRYDLIPNLVEVARGYLQHEASTLEAVTQARSQAMKASQAVVGAGPRDGKAVTALVNAEKTLGSDLGRLMLVVEDYPELKADAQMKSLSEEISSTENRISFARQAFNDDVLAFNDQVSQFPAVLVARTLGFERMQMLQSTANEQERSAVKVQF